MHHVLTMAKNTFFGLVLRYSNHYCQMQIPTVNINMVVAAEANNFYLVVESH